MQRGVDEALGDNFILSTEQRYFKSWDFLKIRHKNSTISVRSPKFGLSDQRINDLRKSFLFALFLAF